MTDETAPAADTGDTPGPVTTPESAPPDDIAAAPAAVAPADAPVETPAEKAARKARKAARKAAKARKAGKIDPETGKAVPANVATHPNGAPLMAFHTYADAEQQAKALGKGHTVEAVGVAFAVREPA